MSTRFHAAFSKRPLAAAAALLSTAALAACSGNAIEPTSDTADGSTSDQAAGEPISIVASTSIWADVAESVAATAQGVDVEITPIVEGNSIDPHHFEPTAADVARAQDADVIVVGGGGYDAWLYDALDNTDNVVHALPLTADEHDHEHEHDHAEGEEQDHAEGEEHDHEGEAAEGEEHDHEAEAAEDAEAGAEGEEHDHGVETIDGNEHIWYDTEAVEEVAGEIAERINAAAPSAGASEDATVERIEAIHERIHNLPTFNYAQTEPIADYIMKYTESADATPESYRQATLSHGEPTAADLASFLDAINNDEIDVLIYNPQTKTDLTERIRTAAEDAGVQIVEIGETPPDGTNFLDYLDEVTGNLEKVQV